MRSGLAEAAPLRLALASAAGEPPHQKAEDDRNNYPDNDLSSYKQHLSYSSNALNSIRRLRARPSAVSFDATGSVASCTV